MALLSGEELHSAGNYLVFMNGMLLGVHRAPHTFVRNFRLLRRSGKMSEFVSVFIHYGQHSIYIASDGGRVCRPLIIVEKGRPRVETKHINEVNAGYRTFNDFLKEGRIEFLDVNEENNCFIALSERGRFHLLSYCPEGAASGLIPLCRYNTKNNTPGNRSPHHPGGLCWAHPVSAPQSIAAQHVPVRHGQTGHWQYCLQSTQPHRHSSLPPGLSSKTSLHHQDNQAHRV